MSLSYCFLTWGVKRERLSGGSLVWVVPREEFVVESRRGAIAEFEFSVSRCEIGKPRWRLVQSPGTQVHGESPHLARAAEERSSPH
jgi:hypothetical protein